MDGIHCWKRHTTHSPSPHGGSQRFPSRNHFLFLWRPLSATAALWTGGSVWGVRRPFCPFLFCIYQLNEKCLGFQHPLQKWVHLSSEPTNTNLRGSSTNFPFLVRSETKVDCWIHHTNLRARSTTPTEGPDPPHQLKGQIHHTIWWDQVHHTNWRARSTTQTSCFFYSQVLNKNEICQVAWLRNGLLGPVKVSLSTDAKDYMFFCFLSQVFCIVQASLETNGTIRASIVAFSRTIRSTCPIGVEPFHSVKGEDCLRPQLFASCHGDCWKLPSVLGHLQ